MLTFLGNASVARSTVSGLVSFRGAKGQNLNLADTGVQRNLDLSGTTLLEDVSAPRSTVSGGISFRGAKCQSLNLEDASVQRNVDLSGRCLRGSQHGVWLGEFQGR